MDKEYELNFTDKLPHHPLRQNPQVIQVNRSLWYRFAKRSMDLAIALIAIILLSPVFLITSIAVMLDGGTPFFAQNRVGKHGVPFRMIKFRSMYMGAQQEQNQLQEYNEAEGPIFKIQHDPRITKVGHLIRRTSIDELPQMFNVLAGNMSIVGPRPPLPEEVAHYTDYHKQRLLVKPGITCYWQCSGRSKIGFEEWIKLDLQYIQEQNIWTDIKILCKTIPAVLKGDGAW